MLDRRREIIAKVASGELSPEEAASRLEETEVEAAPSAEATPSLAAPAGIEAVRVVADFGSVRIYGDASVAGAIAEGPHAAEQDGSTLVINGWLGGLGGFVFGRRGRRRVRIGGDHGEDRIDVRMNPRLRLILDVKAGDVRVDGIEGPIEADVLAGELRIDRFRAPIDINLKAGEVRASGRLDHGASHIRCSAGSVRLELEKGSSVRVQARTTMGNVDLDDDQPTAMIGGGPVERVIGAGAATLEIDATMGDVRVRTDR
ncbi:MAG TPA: DUF4097 family beta strand repeat-containing protein [Candidatus Dormibacteraeota bacterium]